MPHTPRVPQSPTFPLTRRPLLHALTRACGFLLLPCQSSLAAIHEHAGHSHAGHAHHNHGKAAPASGVRTLEIASPWEITGLQPASSGYIFTRLQVAETLVDVDHDGNLTGGLASQWQRSDDGLTWRFTLRPGTRFHDGGAVTAEALLPSLKAARVDPAVLSLAPIADIRAENPQTLRIQLSKPYGALPALLAHSSTLILAPASFDAKGLVRQIIATGPYRIERMTPPQQLTTLRFDGYDGARPAIERVHYLAAGRAETRALMAESGQADLAYTLDPASLQRLRARKAVQIESTTLPRTTLLKLNSGLPALRDVRVRQALSAAIDRRGISTALLRAPDLAATQLMPPSLPAWHDTSLPPLGFDLARAERQLADAGWKKDAKNQLRNAQGDAMSLTLLTFPDRPELPMIATALQAQWKKLGIDVKVNIGNSGDIPLAHRDGSLQLGLAARNYGNVPDPIGVLAQDFAPGGGDWGAMGWSSAPLDQAISSLASGTVAPDAQLPLRREITRILQTELPVIPVTWYQQQVAVSPRIEGVSLDPYERSYRITDMHWKAPPEAAKVK